MGNCLPYNNSDDVSLLRASDSINIQVEQQAQQAVEDSVLMVPAFHSISTVSQSSTSRQRRAPEEEIKIAKRMGLIQHLPMGTYNGSKKTPECVICMVEFCVNESVRFLPCMHIYHVRCIDDWLMRSLTCPSCMEPVDAALLNTYETT